MQMYAIRKPAWWFSKSDHDTYWKIERLDKRQAARGNWTTQKLPVSNFWKFECRLQCPSIFGLVYAVDIQFSNKDGRYQHSCVLLSVHFICVSFWRAKWPSSVEFITFSAPCTAIATLLFLGIILKVDASLIIQRVGPFIQLFSSIQCKNKVKFEHNIIVQLWSRLLGLIDLNTFWIQLFQMSSESRRLIELTSKQTTLSYGYKALVLSLWIKDLRTLSF